MTQIEQDRNNSCPACDTDNLDHSIQTFKAVCEECGFVITEDLDSVSLEWDITNGTFRRPEDKDWLSECRVRNATEKQLAEAFKTLEDLANQLKLSDKLREEAVDVYCDAFRMEVTDGRKTACVVATCLCLASRRVGTPIPMSRLTQFEDVDETKFNRSYLSLSDELDIDPRTPKPREYVSLLNSQLGLTDDEREAAENLVTSVEGRQALVGKDPAGIAAGGVYLLCEDCTQWDVAQIVGLSTETVRQRVKDLQKVVDDV